MTHLYLVVGLTRSDQTHDYDCRRNGFWPGARQDLHVLNLGDVAKLDPLAWADAVYRASSTQPGSVHHIGAGVPEVRRILVARPDKVPALSTGDTVTTCDPAAQTCTTYALAGGDWQSVPTQRDRGEAWEVANLLWEDVRLVGLDDTRGTWRVFTEGDPVHYMRDGVRVCRCCWEGPVAPSGDVDFNVPDNPSGLL